MIIPWALILAIACAVCAMIAFGVPWLVFTFPGTFWLAGAVLCALIAKTRFGTFTFRVQRSTP